MANLPALDQFPSFGEVCAFLKQETKQCIWFLPNQGRLCLCRITAQDIEEAKKLVGKVQKPGLTAAVRVEILEDIVELCCCPRHHRSKVYGTGLNTKVGAIWNKGFETVQAASTTKAPIPPVPRSLALKTFAKHQVHTEESMFERICSPLDLEVGTKGSIYFYTHKNTAFAGMIKIGYTCKTVASRLLDWEQCGHGKPDLLESIGDVRYPERVELLTHFQLLEVWHEIMWCKAHQRTHIEWFKIGVETAKSIASCWNHWMHKANPYDRRGHLSPTWKGRCERLQKLGIPITAELLFRCYQYDVGILKVDRPLKGAGSVKEIESSKKAVIPPKPEVKVKEEPED